ncbi:MAG TPA: hypothetical protein VGD40_24390 [Chryseosolibacter sp.]
MIVHHLNTNEFYEVVEESKRFFIRNERYKAFHAKSDLHATVWDLIDWIRMTNFTGLTQADCENVMRIAQTPQKLETETVMNIICGRKINRVFYEGAYNLITQTFNTAGNATVVLNNETNFFLYEEIIQLLKFSPLKIKTPSR